MNSLETAKSEAGHDDTFVRINDDGVVEVIDIRTGYILAAYASLASLKSAADLLENKQLVEVQYDGRSVLVQRGLEGNFLTPTYRGASYNKEIGDVIIDRILSGRLLKNICKEPGMPSPGIVQRWRMENPDFAKRFEQAREMRAEMMHDDALETSAEVGEDKADVERIKLQTKTYQWSAERNDPRRYGAKANTEAQNTAPVTFVINTGVRRENEVEGEIVVESDHTDMGNVDTRGDK